jgi:L,D-transpeptidase catalytic domain/Putative peptidoglycan binding domain
VLPLALGGVLLLGGAAFAAYRYDAATAHRILPGVEVAGVDVGGLDRSEAITAVNDAAEKLLGRDIQVAAGDQTWHVTPQELGTTLDVEAKVDAALDVSEQFAWPSRVFRRMLDRPVRRSFELDHTYQESQIDRFVEVVSRAVHQSPVNASVTVEEGKIRLTKPTAGRALVAGPSKESLMEAIGDGDDVTTFALRTMKPRVTGKDLGHTIVIRLSQNKLFLFRGVKLRKTYPVATGSPGFPTPQGKWTVVDKAENPSWTNPAPDGWGADLPRFIPAGPGNPLGTRALYLNAPGIRIHGTYSTSSIGSYASHGCIRMHIPDVEELFEIVEVDTPVLIFW